MSIVEIDGSVLEGGGQILRNALSFSCILRRPIKIINIRVGRSKPGLAQQHFHGISLLQQITDAKVEGNFVGSKTVSFSPGEIKSGDYYADTKTAASISLLAQAVLPVLLFGRGISKLDLKGGTNADMAPQVDFITEILRPNMERFGVTFDFELRRRGYFPRGDGHCIFKILPIKKVNPVISTNFGNLSHIFGWSYVAGPEPFSKADQMKEGAMNVLRNFCTPANINIEAYKEAPEVARDSGLGIIIGAITTTGCVLGSSALGHRKASPSETGRTAGEELGQILRRRTCVDPHVQDQVIIYMALADGTSQIRAGPLTLHTKTAIYVAELMTGVKFEVSQGDDCIIKCQGVRVINKNL